ncbi:MAG TPA: hypothetical protein VMS88_05585 [Terriglobales bacterium]|nr:hypothetical protein [Terriglobales bacterium]
MKPVLAVCRRSLVALVPCLAAVLVTPARSEPPAPASQCEYGITLAMSGNLARAESVFVSILAPGRGDARALNNLGNLQLLRGETEVALAFYESALRSDSSDAGIRLNRSVALMMLGREDEATAEAALGIRQAGGLRAAGALLGMRTADSAAANPGRGAEASSVSREEVQSLLAAAARSVPADSSSRRAPPGAGKKTARRASPAWRSGGPRAAEGSDAVSVLYWKR